MDFFRVSPILIPYHKKPAYVRKLTWIREGLGLGKAPRGEGWGLVCSYPESRTDLAYSRNRNNTESLNIFVSAFEAFIPCASPSSLQ